MLDQNIINQVRGVFEMLENEYTLLAHIDNKHSEAEQMRDFLRDFATTSEKITLKEEGADDLKVFFSIYKNGENTNITFRGIPNGHEFNSLLLALINADGKGKNLPDEGIRRRIEKLRGKINLTTYVSLTCTNCPDVVQALNILTLLNPNITHEMVDGALYQDEVSKLNIQAVPTVYGNGEILHIGKSDLGELLSELEDKYGTEDSENAEPIIRQYDVVVLGGGPAGSSAAIYSARKGLKVAVVAGRIGGQVNDTVGIENLISTPKTTGAKLADDLRTHIKDYSIDIYENRKIESVDFTDKEKVVKVKGGEEFKSPAVIIATGASWRKLGVDDEQKYIGKGVHFCPHCDGPFYKDKKVAVIGGGNSGIEAAIDLAGICSKVTVLEFADTLRADDVLQDKVASLPNVEVFRSSQTIAVIGDGTKVTAIKVRDLKTEEEREIVLDGIFVQIGLAANTDAFGSAIELTPRHEIKIDSFCRTNIVGVYAAGDCTEVPYKQIVIAMGEGAKAALSAFDDRIRGVI